MNRLWIRFSGIIFLIVLLLPISFLGISQLRQMEQQAGGESVFFLQEFPELKDKLSEQEIEAIQERMRADAVDGVAGLLIFASFIGLVAGTLLSRSLTAPLNALEAAAGRVAKQDYSQQVAVQGSQELVAVAEAFNQMAKQLEESEQLRRQLLSDVAHELRNPLHILQGNLQAILDGVYLMNREEIGRLAEQTEHLTRLVNDLHELAQAEAHQLSLGMELVDMGAFVKETATHFKPLAVAKKVELKIELLGTMPQLQADRGRLKQVVDNLMSNGLRYIEEGGMIWVRGEVRNGRFAIDVVDNGAGIASEDLPYLFERFYRTDRSRSRDSGGTGLGLAIAQAIVVEHGGIIEVASDGIGKGSCFTVWLPI